jgi:pilus assembly protein CpaE
MLLVPETIPHQGNDMSTQTISLSVQLAVKTTEVRATLSKIINDYDGFVLQEDKEATKVDILILEIGSDPDSEFETIQLLLKENVVGSLFLTSSRTTSDILLPALRAGAKEFFSQPIDPLEVKEAFGKVLKDSVITTEQGKGKTSLGKIYSVLGAKGGVGTTTFAVNFATSVQALDKDKQVALIDMNRLVGEVPLFLDLETDTNWEEIGKNISRLDSAYLQSAMAKHSSGVYVLPAPSKFEAEAHLPPGSLFKLIRAMRQFFDYIIVDSGMALDDSSLRIFAESEAVYLVSIMSLPCVLNVKKLQETLFTTKGIANSKIRVIANRFEKKSQISLAEAKKIIGTDISETIPNNYSLAMTAINSGKTVTEISRKSNVARVYHKLANSTIDSGLGKSGRLFNWFK